VEDERRGGAWRRFSLHVRVRLRQGWRRARWAFVPTLVGAGTAAVAYLISVHLLGHTLPIFAPTAAWLCLGCTLGVALGEVFLRLFGAGVIQIFAVLVISALAARIVDRGEMLTYQAGVQAIVVTAMPVGAMVDGGFGRWSDALVGAVLALFVAALLPVRAIQRPRRRAQAALTELSDLLRALGEALRLGDPDRARDALTMGRDTQQVLDNWEKTVRAARQVTTLNPALRGDRPEVQRLARGSVLADRAVRNARVVARKAESVAASGPHVHIGQTLEELSSSLRLLAVDLGSGERPSASRGRIVEAARGLDPAAYADDGWPTQTLVSVLRSLVVDVLQIGGMTASGARAQLPGDPHAMGTTATRAATGAAGAGEDEGSDDDDETVESADEADDDVQGAGDVAVGATGRPGDDGDVGPGTSDGAEAGSGTSGDEGPDDAVRAD
jgi:uncharacterized membrane protein YgaE (UPF0421/DUF939 family)